jgi:peptide/nickel transport system substrate-binding protein
MSTSEGGFEQFDRFLDEWSRRDFLKRVSGTVAFAAFTAGGVELLEACGNGGGTSSSSSTTTTPKKGGHLVEGTFNEIKTMNSVLISDAYSQIVTSLMFDGLLGGTANGDLFPLVAAAMPQASSDGKTYTFKLRKDVRWSDGRQLTSDDVLFTYEMMFDPKYKAVNSPRRGQLEAYLASIQAPDPYTFVVTTKVVWAPFLALHARRAIMPRHVLGSLPAQAINTADFNSAPSVSSGAFKFVRWDKGQQVVLARNDGYYRGAPHLDQYIFKLAPDSIAMTNQLKTGEVDVAGQIDPSLWDSLATVDTVNRLPTFTGADFVFYIYQLDVNKPGGKLFTDKAVRQALLYALDRQQMADHVYFGQATVGDSVIPPVSWAYSSAVAPRFRTDTKKAQSLLDGAGWAKGPDGIRAKDGIKLQFQMITNVNSPQRVQLLQIMQQAWRDIGVDATPNAIQFPQLVTQLINVRTFDLLLIGFTFDPEPDEAQLFSSLGTAPGGFNGGQFSNAQADQLWHQGAATLDKTKRKKIYKQLQDLYADLEPMPILVFRKGLWAATKRVQGLSMGAYTQFDNRSFFKDLWVSDQK